MGSKFFLKKIFLNFISCFEAIFEAKSVVISFGRKTFFLKISKWTQIFIFVLFTIIISNIYYTYRENFNDIKKQKVFEKNEKLHDVNKRLERKIKNIENQLNLINKYIDTIQIEEEGGLRIEKNSFNGQKMKFKIKTEEDLNLTEARLNNYLIKIYSKIEERYNFTERKIKELNLFAYNDNYEKGDQFANNNICPEDDCAIGGPYIVKFNEKNKKNREPVRRKNKKKSFREVFLKSIANEKFFKLVPFSMPTNGNAKISSRFGYRMDPWSSKTAFHNGIDIVSENGNILSTLDGVVTFAGKMNGYGNLIEIKKRLNGSEVRIRFGHAKKIFVKEGQVVRKNQLIGLQGNEGRSTSSHIHYEVKYNQIYLNPLHLLNEGNRVLTYSKF